MSLEIDIENFPNLSSVFKAIEQERELGIFITTEAEAAESRKEERKPRSSTMVESQPTKHYNLRRRASDPAGQTLKVEQPRVRIQSAPPCLTIDRAKLVNDSRLTEAAKQLSDEELALLYEDILKPLDFYDMLHERRKRPAN